MRSDGMNKLIGLPSLIPDLQTHWSIADSAYISSLIITPFSSKYRLITGLQNQLHKYAADFLCLNSLVALVLFASHPF